ncbi:MAG: hypothetical protein V1888_03755 [archaeon]
MKNKEKMIQAAMEGYYKTMNQLITKSFHDLKNQEIKIIESKKTIFSADAKKFKDFLRLRVNYNLRNYPDNFLKGLFSHELGHFEYFLTLDKWDLFIYGIKYNFSEKYKKRIEKETDINAIKKGYAQELYAQRKFKWNSKNKNTEKLKSVYLSPNEIKEISIKLKKW